MSIKKEVSFAGLTFPNCCHKIVGVMIYDRDTKRGQLQVKLYADEASKSDGKSISYISASNSISQIIPLNVNDSDFDFIFSLDNQNPDGKNIFANAYNWMKTIDNTLPEYKGDCPFDYKNNSTDI